MTEIMISAFMFINKVDSSIGCFIRISRIFRTQIFLKTRFLIVFHALPIIEQFALKIGLVGKKIKFLKKL